MTCTALLAAAMLAGCGGGTQVEFEGKLFEAVGLAGQGEYKEPKVAERPPLLLPPQKQQAALPEPGARQTAVAQPADWPVDPDVERKRQLAEAKAKEKRECENWAFANKKTTVEDFEMAQNPSIRCKGVLGGDILGDRHRGDDSPDTIAKMTDHELAKKPVLTPPAPPNN